MVKGEKYYLQSSMWDPLCIRVLCVWGKWLRLPHTKYIVNEVTCTVLSTKMNLYSMSTQDVSPSHTYGTFPTYRTRIDQIVKPHTYNPRVAGLNSACSLINMVTTWKSSGPYQGDNISKSGWVDIKNYIEHYNQMDVKCVLLRWGLCPHDSLRHHSDKARNYTIRYVVIWTLTVESV